MIKVTCPSNSLYGAGGLQSFPFSKSVNYAENGLDLLNIIGNHGFPVEEDCLKVNIWTKPQSGESQKAVLLFIYGGDLNFGTIADPRYTGKYLADSEDVVVVSMNYRTNIFGFPQAPNTRQNLGLLDQRMAVQWVHDNIAAFGGDPKRIALFGQSVGGAAQDYYSLAWYNDDPIVNGFILESGTALTTKPSQPEKGYDAWYKASNKLGCGGQLSDQDKLLSCMRSKSVTDVLSAISGAPGLESVLAATQFGLIVDDIVAFDNNTERFAAGDFIKRPVLLGNTDDELGVIQPVIHAAAGVPAPQAVIDLVNAQGFDCPISRRAAYSVQAGVPTWRYRWFGLFDNVALGLGVDNSGAYHESELSTVFGTSADFGHPNSAQQDAIQKYTMGAWAAFAKDPDNGLKNYGWPQYASTSGQIVRLAYQNMTGPNAVGAQTYDAICTVDNLPSEVDNLFAEVLNLSDIKY